MNWVTDWAAEIRRLIRYWRAARDLKRINKAADRLNAECLDVLEYQAFDSI